MSNEELAILIQAGDTELIGQLWEQVIKFIKYKARLYEKYLHGNGADIDDLIQSGYFAMLEAIKYFKPEQKYKFLTYLSKTLQNCFAGVSGTRTSRRDATYLSSSLDAPVEFSEGEVSRIDLIIDEQPQEQLARIEGIDYVMYARKTITEALNILNERKRNLMILVYFHGLTLQAAAPLCGYSSKQTAEQVQYEAFKRLRHSSKVKLLREVLEGFKEFDIEAEAIKGVSVQSFKDRGGSATERTAFALLKRNNP